MVGVGTSEVIALDVLAAIVAIVAVFSIGWLLAREIRDTLLHKVKIIATNINFGA
jgi:hypothetical protein